MATAVRATVADLLHVEGKAELIDGSIVTFMGVGRLHGRAALNIAVSLRDYARAHPPAEAMGDSVIYAVPELLNGRESFSPDASLTLVPASDDDEGVIEAPPHFAVEVRSPDDYGPVAEGRLADKRADYFEAGTRAVWDVNLRDGTVTKYLPDGTAQPFAAGDMADAEPALPGWRLAVAEVFASDRGERPGVSGACAYDRLRSTVSTPPAYAGSLA